MDTERQSKAPPEIMLVGEGLRDAEALREILEAHGLKARLCASFGRAQDDLVEIPPRLLLVSWSTGGLNLCRFVKEDPSLKDVYVMVLGSRASGEDQVRALDLGADDFVPESEAGAVLLARIRAGLRAARRLYRATRDSHREALVQMAATLGHEVNNPLTALMGHLELMLLYLDRGDGQRMKHHLDAASHLALRIGEVARRLMATAEPRLKEYLGGLHMLDLEDGEAPSEEAPPALSI